MPTDMERRSGPTELGNSAALRNAWRFSTPRRFWADAMRDRRRRKQQQRVAAELQQHAAVIVRDLVIAAGGRFRRFLTANARGGSLKRRESDLSAKRRSVDHAPGSPGSCSAHSMASSGMWRRNDMAAFNTPCAAGSSALTR
jgi:hypothetical protein